jgi:hypothetical protein
MIKRLNLRTHGIEEGAEIQTEDTENLFNETKAEKFLSYKIYGPPNTRGI